MREESSQRLLIVSALLVTGLLGAFFYQEIFPEYKIYQNDYIELEKFRSTYTSQNSSTFKVGIKQIVIEREDKGPAIVDRCISCHVALQIPYFSPTKIAYDKDGKIVRNKDGYPLLVPNEDYIWNKLDNKIAELRDEQVLAHLKEQGLTTLINKRLSEAKDYEALKTAHVGDQTYEVKKVLGMHPLIGNETRPFELHPVEDYGCTSCHSGNGRGLVTDRAHGPVFDGKYEKGETGHEKIFIDLDSKNDPLFSKIFNHKPGEKLLFQTEPILVGSLIQSKCVQCHQTSHVSDKEIVFSGPKEVGSRVPSKIFPIDSLTQDYHKGERLYLSQACYACHRIAGMARGGVGPDLTKAGNLYPWYMKRKLVWPQGDLPTSTMPNMRLDHEELQDLMIFLLSQKGLNKAESPTTYHANIQAWESGKKMSWEEPLNPIEMTDLRSSMEIFASEGCAACHRLEGFDSNVGFKIEKDSPSPQQLYDEQEWFKGLFPEVISLGRHDEQLSGSALLMKIEQNKEEIDAKIIANAREKGILEEIEAKYPELIESFYSSFRHASRGKNKHYESLLAQEKNSEKAAFIQGQWSEWKERVHRVLMMYIQTYGFGRLIGPHLNWSGIFRSDEWLMEHFRNPSSHIPRSIMPIFPFDQTKFYALTHLLDVLAVRNRNATRAIWTENGFDPEQAFNLYCAQCHGTSMYGNGVIAEWIYPIPKNLRNAEFLRNLTKEQVFQSIMHGVKGTPMPPWGEVSSDKPIAIRNLSKNTPILTESEINYLVDWLFSSLSGGEVIRETSAVPKWNYTAADVLKELQREKEDFKSDSLTDVFDVKDSIAKESDKSYFIKNKFMTPYNLEQGKNFFLMNCAYCHGNEGDGSGTRSLVMQDAKPRMLTNLDWIHSRDDLRLLRSIKYGVAGTSMTPWGDLTSPLQRFQLVLFIRSLTEERNLREKLEAALYQSFATMQMIIDTARVGPGEKIKALEEAREDLVKRQSAEELNMSHTSINSESEILAIYLDRLKVDQQIIALKKEDEELVQLSASIKKEQAIYADLGISLIANRFGRLHLNNYIQMISLNKNRYKIESGKLVSNHSIKIRDQILEKSDLIVKGLEGAEKTLEKEQSIIEGKISSSEQKEKLAENKSEIDGIEKLKKKIVDGTKTLLLL